MLHTRHRLKVDNYVYNEACQIIIAIAFFSSLNLGKKLTMHVIIVLGHYDIFHMIMIHK